MQRPFVMQLANDNRAVFIWVSKVISRLLWFRITTLCDWLAKFAPLSQPMGSQTKTNHVLAARVFPRLAPVTCICFEFWLADYAVYICCDLPEKLLWFWFYDTQLKTATIQLLLSKLEWKYKSKRKQKGDLGCLPFTQTTRVEIFGKNTKWFSLIFRWITCKMYEHQL